MDRRRRDPASPRGCGWRRTLLAAAAGAASGVTLAALARQFEPPRKSVARPLRPRYSVGDDAFLRSVGQLLPPPVLAGNRIETLRNGDRAYPAMLAAIRAARRTVTLEEFIYWSGRMGRTFAEALAERARAGVACHVLLDWYGSKDMDRESLRRMERAGVEVTRYHRRWWRLSSLNHRTHRKLLVVDGRVGFTGGFGIADHWLGDARGPGEWRDNQYRIEGPAVAQLQAAFAENWIESQARILDDDPYFPPLEPAGDLRCQIYKSSPRDGSESMRLLFLLVLGAARRSIRIATAYFVPDDLSIRALVDARRRGVEVDIVVPGPHIDMRIVRRASRDRWGELLRAGVRIHEFMPSMYHCKALIVDEQWTSIGSANFDYRSFRLNDEANLNVYDAEFAREQVRWFEDDVGRSREVTLADWEHRDPAEAAIDAAAGTVAAQL
jgi:cardiolipin synthase